MQPELIDRIIATREGGAVARCHTRQHIGEYTNGRHTYNAVSLLLLLWPVDHEGEDPPMRLVKALQWHDAQEAFCGDVPATIKWRYPLYRPAQEKVEELEQRRLGLHQTLMAADHQWMKALDMLEFYLWATEQHALGNTLFDWDTANCRSLLLECRIPAIVDFVSTYQHKVLDR